MSSDRVTLSVPAKGDYAKTVRMAASAIVSRMGASYDEVEDIRMAADEAFVYAVDTRVVDGTVEFDFTIDEDEVTIEVVLGEGHDLDDEEVESRALYATFIMQSICDRFTLMSDERGNRILRLVKRVGRADDDAK